MAASEPKSDNQTMMGVIQRISRIQSKETNMQTISAVTITTQDDWKSLPMSSLNWRKTATACSRQRGEARRYYVKVSRFVRGVNKILSA